MRIHYVYSDGATDGTGTGGGSGGGTSTGSGGSAGGTDSGAGAATGGTGTATGAAPWHGLTDPEAVSYITNKGWQGPADVIKSYQGAEKLIGRDPTTLLQLPRADDPEGMKAVFQKLGLPDSPDKYDMKIGLPKEAQVDEGFAKSMQGVLHKANITGDQAKVLVTEYNAMQLAAIEQANKDYELNVAADKQSLLDEWKGGHERMMNRAKTAATALGFTPELIDAVEKQVGYAKTYKMFADIGAKLGEDGLVTAGKETAFGETLTPAEAKAQWDQFKMDPNNVKALTDKSHPGHQAAQAKQTKLFSIMYPEK